MMEEIIIYINDIFYKKNIVTNYLKFAFFLTIFVLGTFTFSQSMEAHSSLLEATPNPGVVIQESPKIATLLFNEPVEQDLANLIIYDWNANPVFIGQPDTLGERVPKIEFTIPELENGTYTVKWSVVSMDGHPVNGSYSFAVGKATEGGAKSIASDSKSDGPLIVARTIAQGLIALIAGLYWFSWLAERRNFPGLNTIASKGKTIIIGIIFLATIAELVTYALSLPAGLIGIILKGRWDLLQQFPFIIMVIAQLAVLLLVIIPRMQRGWYISVWFMLTIIPAFGGHVWGMQNPILGLIPRIFHQLAFALWIGALLYIILIITRQKFNKEDILGNEFRTFFVNRMIGASTLVVISGILMVFVQTSWTAVIFDWMNWSTLLLIKVILTLTMLSLALFQTLKWSEQQKFTTTRIIRIEWIVGLVIVFMGVWLSQTMYPITAETYDNILVAKEKEIKVNIDKLQTGEQDMIVTLPEYNEQLPTDIVVNLSMPDHDMRSGPFTSDISPAGKSVIELPFTMPGKWEIKINVEYESGEKIEWIDEMYVIGE